MSSISKSIENSKQFLIKYSDLFFMLAFVISTISVLWIDWIPNISTVLAYINRFRFYFIYLFLGLRLLSLVFIDFKYCLINYSLLVVFLISAYLCRSIELVKMFMFIIAAYKIDFKSVVRYTLIITLAIIALSVISYILGFTKATVFKRGSFVNRRALGFLHPNHLGIFICVSVLCVWFLFFKKEKAHLFIAGTIMTSLFVWFYPNSRTSAISLILFIFLFYICDYIIKKDIKWIQPIIIISPFIGIFFTCLLIYIIGYDSAHSTFLVRFTLTRNALDTYGITLLGNIVEYSGKLILDNSYSRFIIEYGLIPGFIFLFVYCVSIKNILETKNSIVLAIAILFLIYGMMEIHLYNVRFNLSLFMYAASLYPLTNKEDVNV